MVHFEQRLTFCLVFRNYRALTFSGNFTGDEWVLTISTFEQEVRERQLGCVTLSSVSSTLGCLQLTVLNIDATPMESYSCFDTLPQRGMLYSLKIVHAHRFCLVR